MKATEKLSAFAKKHSGFVGNVMTLVTGGVAAQGITFLLSPVITRLFSPEHFGVAALFVSIVSIVSTICVLGLDQAVVVAGDDDATRLLSLSVWVVCAICVALLGAAAAMNFFLPHNTWVSYLGRWIFAIPAGAFLLGMAQVINGMNLRAKQYKNIAGSKVAWTIGTTGSRIGLGVAFGSSVGGLIAGNIIGYMVYVITLIRKSGSPLGTYIAKPGTIGISDLTKRYKDFPLYQTPTRFLNSFSRNLPVLLLGVLFSADVVGLYALAHRVIKVPLDLIARSVNRVYFQKSSDIFNRGSSLHSSLAKTTIGLVALFLVPYMFLVYFGEGFFATLLGERWRDSGQYAAILSIWIYSAFALAPSNAVFVVIRRQGLYFNLQMLMTVARLAVFFTSYVLQMEAIDTILFFSMTSAAVNLLIISIAFGLSQHTPSPAGCDDAVGSG